MARVILPRKLLLVERSEPGTYNLMVEDADGRTHTRQLAEDQARAIISGILKLIAVNTK